MKSITIAAPYYHPETGAAAKRVTAMAKYLVEHGWPVTVVTLFPHHPQNRIYAGFDGPSPRQSSENGVTVIRIRPWIVPKANLALRLLSETLFSLQVAVSILRQKTDVVLASSPYMFLGPMGLLVGRLKGAKFVWDVGDLTWLAPRAVGKRTFGVDKLLDRLMLAVARRADGLTTASEGMLNHFVARPKHAFVLPCALTDSMLTELAKAARNSSEHKRRANVLYAGLLGFAQGLTTLIRTAHLLPDIDFRLVGDGPERKSLEAEAQALGLNNMHFAGHVPFEELLSHYAWADILVAHLRDGPAFNIAQPSKVWEYMATGKPVIYAGEGEVVRIIQEHETGVCVPPDNPEALAEAIRTLLHDPARAAALGARGRAFVTEQRRHSLILEKLAALIDAVLATPRPEEASNVHWHAP